MNGEINGFHGQHSHEGIPNGGTTLNGQADFIRNSLEWITSEMTKFKQEDRELKLKFEHLTQSVSELKVLAHNQPPMTFAYSDSSIGQPSGNATRNTLSKGNTSSSSLVQYTESPSMKRRSRASVTPPKVSNSQISPRTEPKRVLPSIPNHSKHTQPVSYTHLTLPTKA